MEYASLGSTGLRVSRICLGMMSYGNPAWRPWVLPEAESRPLVRRAFELGINFFDTADMYSRGVSEEVTGRLLREIAPRDRVVVATKVFYPMSDDVNAHGLSRYHIFNAIDASLRRLGMDYVDLYQIHRWDPATPIEETLRALDDLVRSGKVRYIGASSMFAWQFAKALALAEHRGWTRLVSMQNHYNLVYREEEREMIPLCVDQGVATLPWSPLARGLLAGNRRPEGGVTTRAQHDPLAQEYYGSATDFAIASRVAEVAAERGVAPAQVALAWLQHRPSVVAPIVGATRMEHVEQAAAACDVRLDPETVQRLDALYAPKPVVGH